MDIVWFLWMLEECSFFFFFQAEDGIRDVAVTGVQTCALPISSRQSPLPNYPTHAHTAVRSRENAFRGLAWFDECVEVGRVFSVERTWLRGRLAALCDHAVLKRPGLAQSGVFGRSGAPRCFAHRHVWHWDQDPDGDGDSALVQLRAQHAF